MTENGATSPLAQAPNGVLTPLYFDRQVVRAEDLTLDRTSRDAELARMRRLLHGWGIVAGLIPVLHEGGLVVTPGYGVMPSGEELYLEEALVAEQVIDHVVACCGPEGRGCELPDEAERTDGEEIPPDQPVTAWLVARPDRKESSLRPGIPDGCEHPATTLMPTRACGGVRLELRCSLPDGHIPGSLTCAELSDVVCGGGKTPPAPVTMPPAPGAQSDFLVVARLVVRDEALTVSIADRRRLLPVSVVQDWLASCVCAHLRNPPEREDTEEEEDEDDVVRPTGPRWGTFGDRLRANGFEVEEEHFPRRPRIPPIVVDVEAVRALELAGIDGPLAFIGADPQTMAEVTGLDLEILTQAQREVGELAVFFRRNRF